MIKIQIGSQSDALHTKNLMSTTDEIYTEAILFMLDSITPTERININPSTHATPAARMGMLNEKPAADTEAHSVHTEASSLPRAELEAQLGQQVFMMV